MSKLEGAPMHHARNDSLDRKAVFDAGYYACVNGNDENDLGPDADIFADDPSFASMWRFGWQRAYDDSVWSRKGLLFE
jgi:hypothetical protein